MTDSCPQRETLLILLSISICVLALFITPVGATTDQAEKTDSLNLDFEEPDRVFASAEDTFGAAIWQGQVVVINWGDQPESAGDEVQLRERIDDTTTRLRDELIVREDDQGEYVVFDTEDLSAGDYFVRGAGTPPGTDLANTFSIVDQELSVDFNRDIVTDEGPISTTEFEVDSNRASYPITIHAEDDLNPNELTEIFVNQGPFDLRYTAEGNDGVTDFNEIGIEPVQDFDEYEVGFEDIEAGNYMFTFTGTDSTAETNDEITVMLDDEFNLDPTATFTYEPDFPDPGETVTFDASGSEDIDGEIVEYQWDFNSDGTTDATGVSPTHTYETADFYEVSLTVVDDDGGAGDFNQLIEVSTGERVQNPEATEQVSNPPHISFQSNDELIEELVWQGQVIVVNWDDQPEIAGDGVQLRERIDDTTTRLRDELVVGEDYQGEYVVFDTEDRTEGDYFLRGGGTPDGTEIGNTFEIVDQELSVDFTESEVTNAGSQSTTELAFSSPRARYPITVTTSDDNLHAGQLADLFGAATIDGEEAFDVIDLQVQDGNEITMTEDGTIGISDSDEYVLNFSDSDISDGDYEFVFSVSDTTARSNSSITVQTEEADDDDGGVDVTGDGNPSQDLTGDGLHEDVDGDGEADIFDVQAMFDNRDTEAVQNNAELFDFADDGNVDIFDVQALFDRV